MIALDSVAHKRDGFCVGNYNGNIRVEIRGSTSARDFRKKSFAVETTDEQGKDLKTDLLGESPLICTAVAPSKSLVLNVPNLL